jgi:flagellar hook-associated protein 1
MSLSGIFNIGKSALMTSQTQLAVTSHNIANATTAGYNRQEVVLEVSTPTGQPQGYVGQGVSVAQIRRQYGGFLETQIVAGQQDLGKYTTLSQTLAGVEQLFNEAQNLGMADPLNDFFNAWQGVADNPEGLTERYELLQKSDALVLSAQNIEQGITGILKQTEGGIADLADQINSLASKIARLNDEIIQAEAGSTGFTANDLRDQRDGFLKNLGNLVEMSSWENKDTGAVNVTVGMRTLVSGKTANTLSTIYNEEGNFDLELDGQNITSRITSGEMGGLLTARQEINTTLHDFRRLMASLTNTVNLQHSQGFGLDGSTGTNFFTPIELTIRDHATGAGLTTSITDYSQLTFEDYTIRFSAGNYEVYGSDTGVLKTSGVYNPTGTTINLEGIQFDISGAVTNQDHFNISPLINAISNLKTVVTSAHAIAASGTVTGLPGDNTNALALAQLAESRINSLNTSRFADYYQTLVTRTGSSSRAAENGLTFSKNMAAELGDRRDSISGVSLDEEAADLIRFQQAYQAAARLIKTADEMFQTLLSL